ncbi:methyl-accepting chemotaxis protein [Thalassotalea fusca]
MLNQLNIKLLLPTAVVGIFFIILLLIVAEMEQGTIVGLLVAMVLVQLGLSYWQINKQVTQRLDKLNHFIQLVVDPDKAPTQPLKDDKGDELAKVTNTLSDFIGDLGDVISEIREESERLKEGAASLSSHMNQSVDAVNNSTHQIEQMAGSIEQIANTSTVLSDNADQVSQTTREVLSILQKGTDSSSTSQKTIESFANEVSEMASDLSLLQEECARIGTVLDVIRGIADQTNLLALNAAIEAARAGEQGRGFAVVADEVRALAHRTQESTVEIQSMVEGLQEKSDNAVAAISRGQGLTEDSLSHSAEVVGALAQIGDVFNQVESLTTQIASGTTEQQKSTASIHDNMDSVVALSREINENLMHVSEQAEKQHATAADVDSTLNRICV